MSHYSVLAIRTKDSNSLEEDMSRYDENAEVEAYVYKTAAELIEDGKDQIIHDLDRDSYKDLKTLSKDEWIDKHDRSYSLAPKSDSYYKFWKARAEVIERHLAGTATDKDYHDYTISDKDPLDEDGNLLSTYNPDSKWDWYSEGGRWGGELAIKPSSQDEYDGEERVDRAYVRDIDWEKMNSLDPEDYERRKRLWKHYVEKEPWPEGTSEEAKQEFKYVLESSEYFKEKYKTFEGYIRSASTWTTFAVLDAEGEWHEPGKMGWFGCSSASTEDERNWDESYYDNFLKDLPEDAELIVLDCHI